MAPPLVYACCVKSMFRATARTGRRGRVRTGDNKVARSGESGSEYRGVSRLAALVLRHLADYPGDQLSERQICGLTGVDPHDGHRLAEWLERVGFLRRVA